MSRWSMVSGVAALLVIATTVGKVQAKHEDVTLAVTMTNDPIANEIKVYDTSTNMLVQTLATRGQGGVGGNARGVRQSHGEIVAVVNNGSNSVTIFRRDGHELRFDKIVTTTSAPVSVDFGNDHLSSQARPPSIRSRWVNGRWNGWTERRPSLWPAAEFLRQARRRRSA